MHLNWESEYLQRYKQLLAGAILDGEVVMLSYYYYLNHAILIQVNSCTIGEIFIIMIILFSIHNLTEIVFILVQSF